MKRRGLEVFKWSGQNLQKLIMIIPLILVVILIAGCSSASAGSPVPSASPVANGLVQSNTGGSVTIDITWQGVVGNTLTLDVTMDTHSVNLDQYDLKQISTLRDDKGNEYPPVSWDSAAGGHHRTGKLAFTLPESSNQSQYFELIVRNIAGIPERVFKWEASAIQAGK